MSAQQLPKYLFRGGDEEMSPPYTFRGLKIRSFPLEADVGRLQKLCDTYLNLAPPAVLEYRPVGRLVFMQVATYDYLASDVETEGWFSENEVSFNMLVARGHRENGRWRPTELAFYFPYIFVDNSWAIATGREVFGYPKATSWLDLPAEVKHPVPMRLETMVLPKLGPKTRLSRRPLIEITKPEAGTHIWEHVVPRGLLATFAGAAEAFKDLVLGEDGLLAGVDVGLFGDVIHTFSDQRIGIVSLKQFRDAAHPGRACYQAIVSCEMCVLKYHGLGLLPGRYAVKLYDYESVPIARDFGLKTDTAGLLTPKLPYWIDFDCQITRGENLFVVGSS